MVTKRVEVRLDEATAGTLAQLAAERQTTISEVMREAVRLMEEDAKRERRHRAVEELCAMEVEDMPDPEDLSRQLASTYDVDLP